MGRTDIARSLSDISLRFANTERKGYSRKIKYKKFKYYNTRGKLIEDEQTIKRINKLVIPPGLKNVWINPSAREHIQAIAEDDKGRKQYFYHPEYITYREESKFEHLLNFSLVLKKIRKAITDDLNELNLTKNCILALIVKIMDISKSRIGNDKYAKDNETYGLTTLRKKHLETEEDSIELKFKGKRSKKWFINIEDDEIVELVSRLEDIPGYRIFKYKNSTGEFETIHSEDVNEYLKEISGDESISSKDFRTWSATVLAIKELKKNYEKYSEASVKKDLVKAVKNVAKSLNNTPQVCKRSYIHPHVLECYEKGNFFKIFTKDFKTSSKYYSADELQAIKFLEEIYH
jgi:DNA topoisomerase-1